MIRIRIKAKDRRALAELLDQLEGGAWNGELPEKGGDEVEGWSYTISQKPRPRFRGLKLAIETDNEAFAGSEKRREVARILHKLADDVENEGLDVQDGAKLRDVNGNTVGEVKVRSPRKKAKKR